MVGSGRYFGYGSLLAIFGTKDGYMYKKRKRSLAGPELRHNEALVDLIMSKPSNEMQHCG